MPNSARDDLTVTSDLPDSLPVNVPELVLIEAYLWDLVEKILGVDPADDDLSYLAR